MKASGRAVSLTDLRVFDSCVTLSSVFPRHHTAADIVAMLDRYGIAEALVHEGHARIVYPREHGNTRLLEIIKDEPRLHPVWVIEPPKQPGVKAARKLVDGMLASGVRAARWPLSRIPPIHWLWADLCAVLEEHRVPCFLDLGVETTIGNPSDETVNGIRDIALAHPDLPLVFSHVMGGLGIHPAILPLIRRTSNVYLDGCGILEFWRKAAQNPGPDRVLFASGFPATDPGLLVSNYQYARNLDEKAKRMMCGGNLRRLLEGVR